MHEIDDEKLDKHIETHRKKHRFLLISIISVSFIIILLWGLAFKNKVSIFKWNTASEKILLDDMQSSWTITEEALLAPQKAKEDAQNIVYEKLTELSNAQAMTTTTTVSTTTQNNNTILGDNLSISTSSKIHNSN